MEIGHAIFQDGTFPKNSAWPTDHDNVGRHIFENMRSSPNNGSKADSYTGLNHCAGTYPHSATYMHPSTGPVPNTGEGPYKAIWTNRGVQNM